MGRNDKKKIRKKNIVSIFLVNFSKFIFKLAIKLINKY